MKRNPLENVTIKKQPISGETIRVFRRSRSGRPGSGPTGGQAGTTSNSAPLKGDDPDEDMHSSKHVEDLPAPDTPAAVKDAGSK